MERVIASCEKGLVVVSIPKSWLPHIKVGHNRKTKRSALLHTRINKAWEFWVEHNGSEVYQRYREIPTSDFVRGGGTWEPYSAIKIFGCSARQIRLG